MVACVCVFAKVSNVVCSLKGCLEVTLGKVDAGPFAIRVVVRVPNVIEMRQLVDHSLNFLGVVWIVHSEVTDVNLLSGVGGIHIRKGVATGTWAGSALAYIGGIILDIVHCLELLENSLEARLCCRSAKPAINQRSTG